MTDYYKAEWRKSVAWTALVALAMCQEVPLAAAASGGGGGDRQQAADRAAQDVARAEDRAARDTAQAQDRAAQAQDRAARAAADVDRGKVRDASGFAEKAARIEQRFAEDRARAAADAAHDPAKATQDLAKAEADRTKSLDQLAGGSSGSGSSGSSGSSGGDGTASGSNSGSSGGSGSSGSSGTSSGENHIAGSTMAADSGSSTTMRGLAHEERPDFDPHGFPVRKGEVVALDLGEAGLAQAGVEGFRVIARDRLDALSGTVTRLDTPAQLEPEVALARLRAIDRDAVFDYTHYYGLQLAPQGSAEPGGGAVLVRRPGSLRVGMIDTGVGRHAALTGTALAQRRFGAGAGAPQTLHGTAVASILVSEGSRQLLVADVFRGTPEAPFTSADAIVQSLEWMAEARVSVVNISLAGPRNAILDRLIERASARGMIVVAAAGNGGPTAPPAYPAALGTVIAVTAVDGQSRIYRYANQGDYIAVAARGVSEPAANASGGIARYSGTSFATPHIAAWLARCLATSGTTVAICRNRLRLAARDVGAPGRDPVYGWGIVDTK